MFLASTGDYLKDNKPVTLDEMILIVKPHVTELKVRYICTFCNEEFISYPDNHGCIIHPDRRYMILSLKDYLNNYYRILKWKQQKKRLAS